MAAPPNRFTDHIDLPIDNIIKGWAVANIHRIVQAYTQKGGWEGWAQVEIAMTLQDRRNYPNIDARDALMAGTSEVLREVPVYQLAAGARANTQPRADVVMHWAQREWVIIELKCEGALYDKPAFVRAVRDDVAKVHTAIDPDYAPARLWVIAFSTSRKTYDGLSTAYPEANRAILWPEIRLGQRLTQQQANQDPLISLWILERDLP